MKVTSTKTIYYIRNSQVWAVENPNEITIRCPHFRFSVNVWPGILGDTLVGPYILPNRLNSTTHLVFLRDIFPDLLDDAVLEDRMNIYMVSA